MKQLEYHLALEKVILEYAASVTDHSQTRTDQIIQIPGYIDAHVWGVAAQLSERGYIKVSEPDDRRGVRLSVLNESGAIRLKELTLTYIRGCFLRAAALTDHRLVVFLTGEECTYYAHQIGAGLIMLGRMMSLRSFRRIRDAVVS